MAGGRARAKLMETAEFERRVEARALMNFGRIYVLTTAQHFLSTCGGLLITGPFFGWENPRNGICKVSLVRFESSLYATNYSLILEIAYKCNSELKLFSAICNLILFVGGYLKLILSGKLFSDQVWSYLKLILSGKLFSDQVWLFQASDCVWLLGYMSTSGIVWKSLLGTLCWSQH